MLSSNGTGSYFLLTGCQRRCPMNWQCFFRKSPVSLANGAGDIVLQVSSVVGQRHWRHCFCRLPVLSANDTDSYLLLAGRQCRRPTTLAIFFIGRQCRRPTALAMFFSQVSSVVGQRHWRHCFCRLPALSANNTGDLRKKHCQCRRPTTLAIFFIGRQCRGPTALAAIFYSQVASAVVQ